MSKWQVTHKANTKQNNLKKKIVTKQELTATVQAQAEKIIRLEAERDYYKKFWNLTRELNTKKTTNRTTFSKIRAKRVRHNRIYRKTSNVL